MSPAVVTKPGSDLFGRGGQGVKKGGEREGAGHEKVGGPAVCSAQNPDRAPNNPWLSGKDNLKRYTFQQPDMFFFDTIKLQNGKNRKRTNRKKLEN